MRKVFFFFFCETKNVVISKITNADAAVNLHQPKQKGLKTPSKYNYSPNNCSNGQFVQK